MGLENIVAASIGSSHIATSVLDAIKNRFTRRYVKLDHNDIARQLATAQESDQVKDLYLSDINSRWGKAALAVLGRYGHTNPDRYYWLDLPEKALAATIKTDDGTIILAYNSKYRCKLASNSWLARLNRLYINTHEKGHIEGLRSESATDNYVATVARYYRENILPGLKDRLSTWKRKLYEKVTYAIEAAGRERAQLQYGR